jgi:hypothetical protein
MDLHPFSEPMKSGCRLTLTTEKTRNQLNSDLDEADSDK